MPDQRISDLATITDVTDAYVPVEVNATPPNKKVLLTNFALKVDLLDHINETIAAHEATAISNVAAGGISSTDVQSAINELDTEKQPIDSDLTAIAGLSPSNDDIIQRKAGAWTNRTIAQLSADLASALVKQTITNGVTDSAPSQDVMFDALALKISSMAVTAHTQQSKADSARYYFGKFYSLAPTVAAGGRKYSFEKNITIVAVRVTATSAVQATTELSTISIRVNNTTNHQLIQINYNNIPAGGSAVYSATGLSIDILSTDECETIEDTPAWVTNPTNTFMTVDIITA